MATLRGRYSGYMKRVRVMVCGFLLASVGVLAVPTIAVAQAYPGGTVQERETDDGDKGDVLGVTESRAQVEGVQAVRGETLPLTGTDVVGLTILGGGLVAGGVVLVRRTRRPALA